MELLVKRKSHFNPEQTSLFIHIAVIKFNQITLSTNKREEKE